MRTPSFQRPPLAAGRGDLVTAAVRQRVKATELGRSESFEREDRGWPQGGPGAVTGAQTKDVLARQSLDVVRERSRAQEHSRSLEGSGGHFLRLGRLAKERIRGAETRSLVWSV